MLKSIIVSCLVAVSLAGKKAESKVLDTPGKKFSDYSWMEQAGSVTGLGKPIKVSKAGILNKTGSILGVTDKVYENGYEVQSTTELAATDGRHYSALKAKAAEADEGTLGALGGLNPYAPKMPTVVTNNVAARNKIGNLYDEIIKGKQVPGSRFHPALDEKNSFLGMSSFSWYRTGMSAFLVAGLTGTVYCAYRLIGHYAGWNEVEKKIVTTDEDGTTRECDVSELEMKVGNLEQANKSLQEDTEKAKSDFKNFYIAGTVLHVFIILAFVYALCIAKPADEEYPEPLNGEDMV